MRISINLATHPFVELRPLFARLRITMAALALLAIGLGIGLHFLGIRARVAEAQMDDLKKQTLAFDTERANNERRMHQPQNQAVLDRSKFLNALFAKKSFSWTSVMMDLESVMPAGIQVTSIEPAITPDGDVNIRLRVTGARDPAVELVRKLERSQRFLQPRLTNETAQSQEQGRAMTLAQQAAPGGVEFEILSGYNPLPAPAKDKKQSQRDASDAVKPAKLVVHKAATNKAVTNKAAPNKPAGPKPVVPGGVR